MVEKYRNVEGLLKIAGDGLCHRCGMCVGICPAGILESDHDGFPVCTGECIKCNLCVEVCSGWRVDYPAIGKNVFGGNYQYGAGLGSVRKAYVGYSMDPMVRLRGASGGVVSQLLIHLLESGNVKGAIVAVQDPDDPTRSVGMVARTREEVLSGAQSRYTVAPTMSAFRQIAKEQGPFAVVGLPCQLHAIHYARMRNPRWGEKIALLIGLFCYKNPPRFASREIGSIVCPKGSKIVDIKYREKDKNGWPSNTVEMKFTDGSGWRCPLRIPEAMTFLWRLYPLGRCMDCLDLTAEFADISVGDPWIRNEKGEWKYPAPEGYSSFIVRTDAGEKAINDAVESNHIFIQSIPPEEIERGQYKLIDKKKLAVPFRLMMKRVFGKPGTYYPMRFPEPPIKIIVDEVLFGITRFILRNGAIRRLLIRLVLSKPGLSLIHRRRKQKKRKFRAREP